MRNDITKKIKSKVAVTMELDREKHRPHPKKYKMTRGEENELIEIVCRKTKQRVIVEIWAEYQHQNYCPPPEKNLQLQIVEV